MSAISTILFLVCFGRDAALIRADKIGGLLASLESKNTNESLGAMHALVRLHDRDVVEPVIGLLRHDNPAVRKYAVIILGSSKDSQAVRPLMQLIKDDSDREIKTESIQALGKLGDRRAVPLLIELLADSDFSTREAAEAALGRLGLTKRKIASIETRQQQDLLAEAKSIDTTEAYDSFISRFPWSTLVPIARKLKITRSVESHNLSDDLVGRLCLDAKQNQLPKTKRIGKGPMRVYRYDENRQAFIPARFELNVKPADINESSATFSEARTLACIFYYPPAEVNSCEYDVSTHYYHNVSNEQFAEPSVSRGKRTIWRKRIDAVVALIDMQNIEEIGEKDGSGPRSSSLSIE